MKPRWIRPVGGGGGGGGWRIFPRFRNSLSLTWNTCGLKSLAVIVVSSE